MGIFREENDQNPFSNQNQSFELSIDKKMANFSEFGNFVNFETSSESPNLFSEIQRINSEIPDEHEVAPNPKVHEIRIGEEYQAGLPNNRNNAEGKFYFFHCIVLRLIFVGFNDDDDFNEGELISYPNQKREREETEEENELDLDLSSLDRISSPKKKCCLHPPNPFLGAPTFEVTGDNVLILLLLNSCSVYSIGS